MKHVLAIGSVAIALSIASPAGADAKLPPFGLHGLLHTSIHVIVFPALISDDEVAGIRDAMAQVLTAGRISVLSEDECVHHDDCAYLEVEIRLLESKSKTLIAYSVRAYVPQLAKLVRDPALAFADELATYSEDQLGLVRAERLLPALRATAVGLSRSYAVVSRRENQ